MKPLQVWRKIEVAVFFPNLYDNHQLGVRGSCAVARASRFSDPKIHEIHPNQPESGKFPAQMKFGTS